MRIAVLPSAYQPAIGGVEELTRQLAIEYRDAGHEVEIYTNRWPRDLRTHEVLDGIPVHRLPFRVRYPSLRGRFSYALTTRRVSAELHRLLRRQRAEVLHVQCVSSNTLYALRAHDRLGIPLVVTTQGELTMDRAGDFQRPGVLPDLLRRAARDANRFTACSAKTLADVEAYLGAPIPGARVIHNGARVAAFRDAQPLDRDLAPYALAIGRLVPQKGFDLLLRAWAIARPDSLRLVVAGDGPDESELRDLARALDLDDRVTFFGPADREQVPRLMAGAEAVVVPSRSDEGLPLVAIESMAAGRALVVSETGGIKEAATDGVDALIVPRDDVDALASAITRIAFDPSLRVDLGRAAQQRAADFDWSTLAAGYLDCFRLAADAGHGRTV
jgi:glycosyltransferase involved in cell wall biosynthesis